MPEYDTLFNKEIVAQMATDAGKDQLGFPRFFNKVPLEEQTDYYSWFEPEMEWEEAEKKGKLGKVKKIAEGAEFLPITVGDYTTKTEAFGLIGGKLTLTLDQMSKQPIQSMNVINEASKLITNTLNAEFIKFYDKRAKHTYNQTGSEDIFDWMIEAQETPTNSDIDFFTVGKTGYKQARKYLKSQGESIKPAQDIKTYFKVPAIEFQDGVFSKNTKEFNALDVRAIEINDPGIDVMYSPRLGTTQAPVEEGEGDWGPMFNVKEDDTRMKQDPAKIDWFMSIQYFFLANNTDGLLKGKLKA